MGELFLVHDHLVVLLTEFHELLVHLVDFLPQGDVFALIVLETHFVFFELPQEGLEFVFLYPGLLKGFFHLVVGDLEFGKGFLVVLDELIDV